MLKKKTKKRQKLLIGTILTAVSLATILGIFISGWFHPFGEGIISSLKYIGIPILSVLFIIWGRKNAKSLELTTYAIAGFLFLAAIWDWYAQDWSNLRTEIMIPAIISITINALGGRVKLVGAKKTFKGQLGLK